ncbi:Asx homology domain-containing protein [Radiomyces spectabilis]|uniref:Asx homology domain-containing protein n=1 Tax=Radiomyces spectabilis TaxID=64574 RepID=UPI002220EB2F|nr:Asx homology domain-containing protein [Radiomyces spectabilis]KAI8374635.1 Asx homology domain-containing protein [Radiomyces spectabilis]
MVRTRSSSKNGTVKKTETGKGRGRGSGRGAKRGGRGRGRGTKTTEITGPKEKPLVTLMRTRAASKAAVSETGTTKPTRGRPSAAQKKAQTAAKAKATKKATATKKAAAAKKTQAGKKTTGKGRGGRKKKRDWTLEELLTNAASPLATIDMRMVMKAANFDQLDRRDHADIVKHLPKPEVTYRDSSGNEIHPGSNSEAVRLENQREYSPRVAPNLYQENNVIFWNAVHHWQESLAAGEFEKPSAPLSPPVSPKRRHDQVEDDNDWKDNEYENYWGERLERERKRRRPSDESEASDKEEQAGSTDSSDMETDEELDEIDPSPTPSANGRRTPPNGRVNGRQSPRRGTSTRKRK